MEHSHYINYCKGVEAHLQLEIIYSEWYKNGNAATILNEMYLPAGIDSDYLQSVAEKITHEYHHQTPKKTLF